MDGNAYRDKCNRCSEIYPNAYGYNFCPNCGAKMEWGEGMTTLRERVTRYCKENKISQREFAKLACISKNSLQNYIYGDVLPNILAAKMMAKVLGITLDELAEEYRY